MRSLLFTLLLALAFVASPLVAPSAAPEPPRVEPPAEAGRTAPAPTEGRRRPEGRREGGRAGAREGGATRNPGGSGGLAGEGRIRRDPAREGGSEPRERGREAPSAGDARPAAPAPPAEPSPGGDAENPTGAELREAAEILDPNADPEVPAEVRHYDDAAAAEGTAAAEDATPASVAAGTTPARSDGAAAAPASDAAARPAEPQRAPTTPVAAATASAARSAAEPPPSRAREAATRQIAAVRDPETWKRLFHREPLGFDQQTPARAYYDLAGFVQEAIANPSAAARRLQVSEFNLWISGLILLLIVAAGLFVEWRRPASWTRLWIGARRLVRRSTVWAIAVAVVRRASIPGLALIAWMVIGMLAGVDLVILGNGESLLSIWFGYRLLDGLFSQLSARRWRSREVVASLYGRVHRLLQFAAVWLGVWLLLHAFSYREDVVALVSTAGHLILVLGIFQILADRAQFMQLLPQHESRHYFRLTRAVRAIYLPVVYFSLFVSLLWVAGYHNLATVFLGRSWAVLGIWLFAFALHQLGRLFFRRWLPEDPERAALRESALAASHRALTVSTVALAVFLSLRAVGLIDVWTYVLEPNWFVLGSFNVSGAVVWTTLLVLVTVYLVSGWFQAMLAFRVYPRLGIEQGEAYALNRLMHYAFMAIAALLVLNNLGLSPESLALVAGGLSVGIGFGLQEIANNLASGLILLTSRQIRQGDIITVGTDTGTVREVSLRSTLVRTFEGVDLLIPNSRLLGETLTNWTHTDRLIRTRIPFGVSYASDPDVVLEVANRVTREHPDVLVDPAPDVWFTGMGDNSLDFVLLFWIDMSACSRPKVTTEIYCALFRELKASNVEIPFPQRDLHLRSGIPWKELLAAMQGGNGHGANGDITADLPTNGDAKAASKLESSGDAKAAASREARTLGADQPASPEK
jgi:small-conductance mechanosensitive channel